MCSHRRIRWTRYVGSIVFEDGTEPQGNLRGKCKNRNLLCIEMVDSGFCFPEGTLPPNMDYAFDLVQQSIQRYMQIP